MSQVCAGRVGGLHGGVRLLAGPLRRLLQLPDRALVAAAIGGRGRREEAERAVQGPAQPGQRRVPTLAAKEVRAGIRYVWEQKDYITRSAIEYALQMACSGGVYYQLVNASEILKANKFKKIVYCASQCRRKGPVIPSTALDHCVANLKYFGEVRSNSFHEYVFLY